MISNGGVAVWQSVTFTCGWPSGSVTTEIIKDISGPLLMMSCEVMRIVCVLFEVTVVFRVSECFSPEAVGVPELNELESSSFKDGIRWRKLLTQAAWPEILPPCLTLSLSSFQGGLTVPSSLLVSLALSSLSRFFSSRAHLPYAQPLSPYSFPHFFLGLFSTHTPSSLLLPPSLLRFFGLEWTRGMRVTGTRMGGGRRRNERKESFQKTKCEFWRYWDFVNTGGQKVNTGSGAC